MLYQTQRLHHHPFLFHSHALPLSAISPSTSCSLFSSFLQEMECVDAALKTNFRKEMKTPPVFPDDFSAINAQNGVSTDDFSVDDLLDFSDDAVFVNEEEGQTTGEDEEQGKHEVSVSTVGQPDQEKCILSQNTDFSDFGSVTADELPVPADELADLEWLSHFVEDCFSAPYLAGQKPAWVTVARDPPVASVTEESCFKSPVPAKARSKRSRSGGRLWSLGSTSLTDSSGSTTSSSSSSQTNPPLLLEPFLSEKPKKQKRKLADAASIEKQPRRCTHCGVQKTPQWRAGPLGAKTLCNACGVRYKSGRLLPEYRPACSPTFSSELHSNHHRKVLEMRKKKETTVLSQKDAGGSAVTSF